MRTADELMVERREALRKDPVARMRMAMRDLSDVHLHPELPDITEQKPQEQIVEHHHYHSLVGKDLYRIAKLEGALKKKREDYY